MDVYTGWMTARLLTTPHPPIPTRYTGTAGERTKGLPVDLGVIAEATIDFEAIDVDENKYSVY